jgi:MFS family permease
MPGTIVTSTAKDIPTFVGGRFLLSFFSTLASTAAPLYLIEIAPPLYRGTLAGLYNTLYYMGSILATFTVYGTNLHLQGDIVWRLPLWLQMVCPGIVALFIWFLPESPRWLIGGRFLPYPLPEMHSVLSIADISKGKERFDEARAIVVQYHANGDATHPIVNLEMSEMAESMQNGGMMTWKGTFDIRNLFNTRARRYRLALCIAFSWFGQFSGNNIASYVLRPLSYPDSY